MQTPFDPKFVGRFLATIIATNTIAVAGPRGRAESGANATGDTLVVFLASPDAPAGDVPQSSESMTALEGLAAELGVTLDVRDATAGAPAEVVITPLIVFQNHRGRSIYQGRYSNIDRIRNFVRTSRFVPQEDVRLERTDILAWTTGRATMTTPVKLTALGGDTPEQFDASRFQADAIQALADGMERFDKRAKVSLGRGDRAFHLDVHPYLEGDILYLSCEIYSQFNCHEPVYSAFDDPQIGFWDDRDALFRDVGKQLEREVLRLVAASPIGDAFRPVPESAIVTSWANLGLDLPPASAVSGDASAFGGAMPNEWTVVPAESTVLFRFAPPLDNYAGEARTIDGNLRVGSSGFAESEGVFTVPIRSLTMGEPLLDKDLQTDTFFGAETHPTSRFRLERIEADASRLRFGDMTPAIMHGVFEMKGLNIPLAVRTQFEPYLDAGGEPRLLLTADWSVRLRQPFGLQGPDGPAPANDTVLFQSHLVMRPEIAGRATSEN